jgi:hypothetical protein
MPAHSVPCFRSYPCLWTLEKKPSVSQVFDGGKWTCGVREIGRRTAGNSPCVIYSAGSDGNDQFERAVNASAPNCRIFVFDPTISSLPLWDFTPVAVASSDGELSINGKPYQGRTIASLMQERGHDHLDILKMDVEGAEWGLLESTPWSELCIGELLVELHDNHQAKKFPMLLDRYIKPLEAAGLRLYSIEPVCSGCAGQFELAFINVAWHPGLGFKRSCKVP